MSSPPASVKDNYLFLKEIKNLVSKANCAVKVCSGYMNRGDRWMQVSGHRGEGGGGQKPPRLDEVVVVGGADLTAPFLMLLLDDPSSAPAALWLRMSLGAWRTFSLGAPSEVGRLGQTGAVLICSSTSELTPSPGRLSWREGWMPLPGPRHYSCLFPPSLAG